MLRTAVCGFGRLLASRDSNYVFTTVWFIGKFIFSVCCLRELRKLLFFLWPWTYISYCHVWRDMKLMYVWSRIYSTCEDYIAAGSDCLTVRSSQSVDVQTWPLSPYTWPNLDTHGVRMDSTRYKRMSRYHAYSKPDPGWWSQPCFLCLYNLYD